jgi:hypothetical protein
MVKRDEAAQFTVGQSSVCVIDGPDIIIICNKLRWLVLTILEKEPTNHCQPATCNIKLHKFCMPGVPPGSSNLFKVRKGPEIINHY